ncbi:MAG: type VII secretion target [Galactobacter sp.]
MSGYVVYGGEQAAVVVVPELQDAAGQWRRAAQALAGLLGISANSVEWGAPGEPSLAVFGTQVGLGGEPPSAQLQVLRSACRQAWDAVGQLGRVAHQEAEDLANKLDQAARAYAQAEQNAIQQIDVFCSPLPDTLGWDAVLELVRGLKNQAPPEQRVAAEALATLLGRKGTARAGDNAHESEWVVTALTGGLAGAMGLAGVKGSGGKIAVQEPQAQEPVAATGLPGLIDLQMKANQGEDGSGAIVVTRMSAAGSSGTGEEDTWVVTVPGTINTGDAVWGNQRLPQAMGSDTSDVAPAVMAALDKVGVPDGAKIVLNGHSQGGRHALNLSTDESLCARYRITGVVTAGAPSGSASVTPGMTVVQLEDPDDSVPGLDGSTWVQPTQDRFLVRSRSEPAPQVEGGDPGFFGWEHKGPNYRSLAEQVQAGTGHTELSAAVGGLGIGAAGGVTSKSWVVPTSQAEPRTPAKTYAERPRGVRRSGRPS